MHGEPHVNDLWTQDERYIRSASGVILTLYFVGNQEKVAHKLNVQYCYRESWQINQIISNTLQIIFMLFYLIPYYLCLEITVKWNQI